MLKKAIILFLSIISMVIADDESATYRQELEALETQVAAVVKEVRNLQDTSKPLLESSGSLSQAELDEQLIDKMNNIQTNIDFVKAVLDQVRELVEKAQEQGKGTKG